MPILHKSLSRKRRYRAKRDIGALEKILSLFFKSGNFEFYRIKTIFRVTMVDPLGGSSPRGSHGAHQTITCDLKNAIVHHPWQRARTKVSELCAPTNSQDHHLLIPPPLWLGLYLTHTAQPHWIGHSSPSQRTVLFTARDHRLSLTLSQSI